MSATKEQAPDRRGSAIIAVLYRLAQLCLRRRFVGLGVWLVATIALVAVPHRLGDDANDNLLLPGTDSQHAADVVKRAFPVQADGISVGLKVSCAGCATGGGRRGFWR